MRFPLLFTLLALALGCTAAGCQSVATLPHASSRTGSAGTLLIVGGGLEDDARPVYERLLALASARGPARIVIVTAATGDQEVEVTDKTESLRAFAPEVEIEVLRRETSTADTVQILDRATGLLFTGGDQKRITERYRPGDQASPEYTAMQRLLARGGVIAGCSAGDAMMGNTMLLGGGSQSALGLLTPGPDEPDAPGAVRIGPGMGFLPWAITDSHFFERDRIGRLVAALEASGERLGIGVGEDACVEVDLASGLLTGITASESLLVDALHLEHIGRGRYGLVARLIGQGESVSLPGRLATLIGTPPERPELATRTVPIVEPGQNRQLASWRLFRHARVQGSVPVHIEFEGWQASAWALGDGKEVVLALEPR